MNTIGIVSTPVNKSVQTCALTTHLRKSQNTRGKRKIQDKTYHMPTHQSHLRQFLYRSRQNSTTPQ